MEIKLGRGETCTFQKDQVQISLELNSERVIDIKAHYGTSKIVVIQLKLSEWDLRHIQKAEST